MPTIVHPSGRSARSRMSEATPATATGNATAVSRTTLTMNCGRVSSLPLGGGFRNQCTLVQPWPASQTRLGTSSAAAIARASGKPRERSTSRRQTKNSAISSTSTTASVYFVSSPIPGCNSEQRPRAASERESERQPEDDHRRQLVERDRLEEQVGGEHPRREPDDHRGERLRSTRRPELAGHQSTHDDRPRARQDREERAGRRATSRTALGRVRRPVPSRVGTRRSRPADAGRRRRSTARRGASRTGPRRQARARI